MPEDYGVAKLQQRTAACTDELLDISEEIGRCVLPLYTGENSSTFDLQCRLQMERCRQLSEELAQIRGQLEEAIARSVAQDAAADGCEVTAGCDTANGCHAADELIRARRQSAQITLQLIAQNQAMLIQKQKLLQELLIGSEETQSRLKAAEALRNTADVAALRSALGKELARCRNGNENSN